MTKDQHAIRDFNRARWQLRNEWRRWKGFAGLLALSVWWTIHYGE